MSRWAGILKQGMKVHTENGGLGCCLWVIYCNLMRLADDNGWRWKGTLQNTNPNLYLKYGIKVTGKIRFTVWHILKRATSKPPCNTVPLILHFCVSKIVVLIQHQLTKSRGLHAFYPLNTYHPYHSSSLSPCFWITLSQWTFNPLCVVLTALESATSSTAIITASPCHYVQSFH